MLLKKGTISDDVVKLQQKLKIDDDGIFGSETERNLKEWQSSNGLKSTGIVDDETWNKMFGISQQSINESTINGFNLEKLRGVIPDSVIEQIPDTAKKFNITNVLRLSHFLAQCSHESGNFTAVRENLNYSATGLKKTFSKYFPGKLSESYARQPEKIANRVYANRMGNGDESSGDGYKFRGRGYIQLTGKDNYSIFDKSVDEKILENPDLVATKYPLMSAAFFFNKNNLWTICDKGSSDDVVTQVTKRVNGGVNGLDDRIKKFKKYYGLLK
jgi:putative chitinase